MQACNCTFPVKFLNNKIKFLISNINCVVHWYKVHNQSYSCGKGGGCLGSERGLGTSPWIALDCISHIFKVKK